MAEVVKAFLDNWYLSTVPAVIFLKTALVGTRRLKSVLAELDSAVETSGDLRAVREAINTNMLLAALTLTEFAVFALVWTLISLLWVNVVAVMLHALIFAIVSTAGGVYALGVEREFKAMRVASADPEVRRTLERWFREWRELRLQLPE